MIKALFLSKAQIPYPELQKCIFHPETTGSWIKYLVRGVVLMSRRKLSGDRRLEGAALLIRERRYMQQAKPGSGSLATASNLEQRFLAVIVKLLFLLNL